MDVCCVAKAISFPAVFPLTLLSWFPVAFRFWLLAFGLWFVVVHRLPSSLRYLSVGLAAHYLISDVLVFDGACLAQPSCCGCGVSALTG